MAVAEEAITSKADETLIFNAVAEKEEEQRHDTTVGEETDGKNTIASTEAEKERKPEVSDSSVNTPTEENGENAEDSSESEDSNNSKLIKSILKELDVSLGSSSSDGDATDGSGSPEDGDGDVIVADKSLNEYIRQHVSPNDDDAPDGSESPGDGDGDLIVADKFLHEYIRQNVSSSDDGAADRSESPEDGDGDVIVADKSLNEYIRQHVEFAGDNEASPTTVSRSAPSGTSSPVLSKTISLNTGKSSHGSRASKDIIPTVKSAQPGSEESVDAAQPSGISGVQRLPQKLSNEKEQPSLNGNPETVSKTISFDKPPSVATLPSQVADDSVSHNSNHTMPEAPKDSVSIANKMIFESVLSPPKGCNMSDLSLAHDEQPTAIDMTFQPEELQLIPGCTEYEGGAFITTKTKNKKFFTKLWERIKGSRQKDSRLSKTAFKLEKSKANALPQTSELVKTPVLGVANFFLESAEDPLQAPQTEAEDQNRRQDKTLGDDDNDDDDHDDVGKPEKGSQKTDNEMSNNSQEIFENEFEASTDDAAQKIGAMDADNSSQITSDKCDEVILSSGNHTAMNSQNNSTEGAATERVADNTSLVESDSHETADKNVETVPEDESKIRTEKSESSVEVNKKHAEGPSYSSHSETSVSGTTTSKTRLIEAETTVRDDPLNISFAYMSSLVGWVFPENQDKIYSHPALQELEKEEVTNDSISSEKITEPSDGNELSEAHGSHKDEQISSVADDRSKNGAAMDADDSKGEDSAAEDDKKVPETNESDVMIRPKKEDSQSPQNEIESPAFYNKHEDNASRDELATEQKDDLPAFKPNGKKQIEQSLEKSKAVSPMGISLKTKIKSWANKHARRLKNKTGSRKQQKGKQVSFFKAISKNRIAKEDQTGAKHPRPEAEFTSTKQSDRYVAEILSGDRSEDDSMGSMNNYISVQKSLSRANAEVDGSNVQDEEQAKKSDIKRDDEKHSTGDSDAIQTQELLLVDDEVVEESGLIDELLVSCCGQRDAVRGYDDSPSDAVASDARSCASPSQIAHTEQGSPSSAETLAGEEKAVEDADHAITSDAALNAKDSISVVRSNSKMYLAEAKKQASEVLTPRRASKEIVVAQLLSKNSGDLETNLFAGAKSTKSEDKSANVTPTATATHAAVPAFAPATQRTSEPIGSHPSAQPAPNLHSSNTRDQLPGNQNEEKEKLTEEPVTNLEDGLSHFREAQPALKDEANMHKTTETNQDWSELPGKVEKCKPTEKRFGSRLRGFLPGLTFGRSKHKDIQVEEADVEYGNDTSIPETSIEEEEHGFCVSLRAPDDGDLADCNHEERKISRFQSSSSTRSDSFAHDRIFDFLEKKPTASWMINAPREERDVLPQDNDQNESFYSDEDQTETRDVVAREIEDTLKKRESVASCYGQDFGAVLQQDSTSDSMREEREELVVVSRKIDDSLSKVERLAQRLGLNIEQIQVSKE